MNLRSRNLWLTLGAFVFLAAFGFWLKGRQPVSELDAYKQQLRAQGEKLDYKEFIPTPPAPERDGTAAMRAAIALTDSLSTSIPYSNRIEVSAMRMVAPGRAE